MEYDAIIGVGAATLTPLSNLPQLKKCWQTGKAENLNLRAFVMLAVGVALWLVYGALKSDWTSLLPMLSLLLFCEAFFSSRFAAQPSGPQKNLSGLRCSLEKLIFDRRA